MKKLMKWIIKVTGRYGFTLYILRGKPLSGVYKGAKYDTSISF